MAIANEKELLSTIMTSFPSVRRALVFAPHPDDEVFGCGGTLSLLRSRGCIVTIIVVTDGAMGRNHADGNLIETRAGESRAAAKELGLNDPIFWGLPDRGLKYGEVLISQLTEAVLAAEADLVFIPSPTEWHPDHQIIAFAGAEAVRRLGGARWASFFEVANPLPCPNLIHDISLVEEKKHKAMRCFDTQLLEEPYDCRISGINCFRAFHLGEHVKSAEAFTLLSSADLGKGLPKLLDGPLAVRQNLGFAVASSDMPLISVIIRSMDRPTLLDALNSLALQTYPNIEVVLVNARGSEHQQIDQWRRHYPIHMISPGIGLLRSRAANMGLDAAHGEYLMFLDDDDWVETDHIQKLAVAIRQHPEFKAVYTGVKCVDERRNPLAKKFDESFDAFPIVAGNFIPIHAVLFSRSLLVQGCRMDESLELYEDWDFWIQLSRFGDFLKIGGLSAVYRITHQTGFGINADSILAERAAWVLYKKWFSQLGDRQITLLMNAVKNNTAKDYKINSLNQALDERNRDIANLNQAVIELGEHIANLNQTIASFRASSSWRITGPLRMVTHQIAHVRRSVEFIAPAIKRGGGMKSTFKKLLQLYRREGVAGIRRGFKIVAYSSIGAGNCNRFDYAEWLRRYDTLTDKTRAIMRERMDTFEHKPLISVLMPTYNPKPEWLIEAIESVCNQIYPHWELCIADDASTDKAIRPILERYASENSRIKVVLRERNGHISAASNSAWKLVSGAYVALLDHDDTLSEHALFWVADAINQYPDVQLIYSDEDKIDNAGRRFDPYFKCDWNVDLFYSHNMLAHLGVYRADLLNAISGFTDGMEGAQDYDLALRYTERIESNQIHHIPRVLYHWRIHDESTAQSLDAKPYAMLAGERALNGHFQRLKISAKAEFIGNGYRVRYALPDTPPMVSLIIPTRNGVELIQQCIKSILNNTTYPNYEIIIVDNGSNDPETLRYFDEIKSNKNIRVVRDSRPFNFSALNNAAVKIAFGDVVGLLNSDLEIISPEWLSEMVSIALQPSVGAVGASLWYPNETLQHGGVIVGLGGVAGHSHKHLPRHHYGYYCRAVLIQSLSAITAACMVIRKAIYEKVGGLNEEDLPVAFNDVDFCLRMREAGYRNIWTPYAELYHHESATRGFDDTPEKMARFAQEVAYMKRRWGDQLLNDPAYSPNLTLDHEDFSLAWPPRLELV